MPRRTKMQRRGKGKPKYTAKSHRFAGKTGFVIRQEKDMITGRIVEILHDRGRTAPLIRVKYEDNSETLLPAPAGVYEGQVISEGFSAPVEVGNVLPLSSIPEGTSIFNIEKTPGDKGKLVRSSGSFAKIVTKEKNKVLITLPSKKVIALNPNCKAIIGQVAGGGRKEKPFVKAGKKFYAVKVRSKVWPRVSATAMNAIDHPLGGGTGRHGKHFTTSRRAPRGARVGSIAPKRTGRKKR